MNSYLKNFVLLSSLLILGACSSKPKVIEAQGAKVVTTSIASGFKFPDAASAPQSVASSLHQVKVEEVLNTEKYSYLRVQESGSSFWVAVSKQDISVGDEIAYSGGILKKNFYSREFDRIFDTVYLVSRVQKKTGTSPASSTTGQIPKSSQLADVEGGEIQIAEGSISLAQLLDNKTTYDSQIVQVTGKVVKVNPNIMNRNWIHLQDGSQAGLDLTITTSEIIRLGDIVTLEGMIMVDKDFGAGYRYDVIMEGALLK